MLHQSMLKRLPDIQPHDDIDRFEQVLYVDTIFWYYIVVGLYRVVVFYWQVYSIWSLTNVEMNFFVAPTTCLKQTFSTSLWWSAYELVSAGI